MEDNCNRYNQYYDEMRVENGKCFNGKIYNDLEKFNINNYKNYKSDDYYSWINNNFKTFPEENYDSDEYSPDQAFANICENNLYSLKQQQKFAGRIFNTFTKTNSMLIYHGLGSGKTQTSIVIGEAFKFRKTNNSIIPGREESLVHIVVPASLQNQYYSEIIGKYESGEIKSASGEIWISGDRQYYTSKTIRKSISSNNTKIKLLE